MVGSAIYTFLQAFVTIYTVYWPLTIGLIIMMIVLFAPGGVLGLVEDMLKRIGKAGAAATKQARYCKPGWNRAVTRNILEVRGLQKHFGGNFVTQDISLDIAEGSKEAIIGPNGAGKTTFFNLLTGYHRVRRWHRDFRWAGHHRLAAVSRRPRGDIARLPDQQHLFPHDGPRERTLGGDAQMGKSSISIAGQRWSAPSAHREFSNFATSPPGRRPWPASFRRARRKTRIGVGVGDEAQPCLPR